MKSEIKRKFNMKAFMKIMLLPISLWAGCGNRNFTPGTYVNHAESAYSVADDTLVINSDYQVTHRTGFRRKGGQWQQQTKTYAAVWDETKHSLQLTGNGLVMVFRGDEVIIGNTIYRRP
jgi:hypothetical protein